MVAYCFSKSRIFLIQPALAAFIFFVFAAPVLRAGQPSDDLLRLVPDDVTFCLVLKGLREHGSQIQKSPFVEQILHSPVVKSASDSSELHKLQNLDKFLEATLGVSATRLFEDVFGDAVVFAYRGGPKPEEEQGLVLVHARDPKTLAGLIESLNKAQKGAGDVKGVSEHTHKGVTYFRRIESKGDDFYWLNGPRLVVATQEGLLREAIERDHRLKTGEESFVAKQFKDYGAEKALLSLWINPRPIEAELEKKASVNDEGAIAPKAFLGYWKALEGLVLAVDIQENIEINLSARINKDRLPPSGKSFWAEAAKRSLVAHRLPADAMLWAAGRIDLAAFNNMIAEFLMPEVRDAARARIERSVQAAWEKDFFKDILPNLGPDFGLALAAPASADKAWFPRLVFVYQIRPGDKEPPVDQSALSALVSLAQFAVLAHNNQGDGSKDGTLYLKTVQEGKTTIRYLTGSSRFPPGMEPAFTLDKGCFIFGSSPEVVREALGRDKSQSPDQKEIPLLRVSFAEMARFVNERKEPLAAFLAEKNNLPKEEVVKQLEKMAAVLAFVDRAEILQMPSDNQIRLSLRIKPIKPLK